MEHHVVPDAIGTTEVADAPQRIARRHWSETLPPGNGKSPFAGVWMIPATVAAAIVAGLTIRGWLG